MLHHRILLAVLTFTFTAPVLGKEWARKMFERTEHDFGVVARGANAEFDFELQNIYQEEVHISSVRSSCGCVSPSIVNDTLETWQKGKIHVKFNTRAFLGQKKATVTVTIDRPYFAEVQLQLSGFIRQDVVFDPGIVDFGQIDGGTEEVKSVNINYAGKDSWAIVDVETPSEFILARWRETQRGKGRVGYELQVRLTGQAPAGYITDHVVLVTNDQHLQRIPLELRGRIVPSVTVSPSALQLGVLTPGQKVTKMLLVKGARPFQVTRVHCEGDCLVFGDALGSKSIHKIPVTFTAGEEPGDLAFVIHIETDLGRGGSTSCMATASVRGPSGGT